MVDRCLAGDAKQRREGGFMHARLENGCSFRTFDVIDDYSREGLRIEVDPSLSGA